ncbi:MAG: HNH endonuclease [Planctomycetes bacterium]|nr:HNH endonuclease [Planctomycetota bacterium]MBL7037809.1 HNH endonuclease [Pirellulaceae bacterium]
MTNIPEHLRTQVVARGSGRCEYCGIPVQGQIAWFPIDHVLPRSQGGKTELTNLAMACPRCNGHKWAHETGPDPDTGTDEALFNPRTQVWTEHFRWSPATLEIEGKTPCGRATVVRLRMNDPEIVAIRHLLTELGIRVRDQQ